MNRTDQHLSTLLHRMVEAEPLPPCPLGTWLDQDSETPTPPITARWPENLRLKPPSRLILLAASAAMASWLAVLQLSGWINPMDIGANRLLADAGVQQNLQDFLRCLFGA